MEVYRERWGTRLSQPGMLGGSGGRQSGLTRTEPVCPPPDNLGRKAIPVVVKKHGLVESETWVKILTPPLASLVIGQVTYFL